MSFTTPSRRRFLMASAALGTLAALPFPAIMTAQAAVPRRSLTITTRSLDIDGKAATVFGITQPNGTSGLILDPGETMAVDLTNATTEDTIIHWHGQTPPYLMDGVADASRPVLTAGETRAYDFTPVPGTHWMHSHHGLQEARLLAAPLIVRTAEDAVSDRQEVVLLLHDFTFRSPEQVLAELNTGAGHPMPGMSGQHSMHGQHAMHGMGGMSGMGGMAMAGMDLNDVDYDAYLTNDRTLNDPDVIQVDAGGRVLLRIINGAVSTAFHLQTAGLEARLVAVDGIAVQPLPVGQVPLSMGQRIDLEVTIPKAGGAFPILALREGGTEQTGLILATPGATVTRVSTHGATPTAPLDLGLEGRLRAASPLPSTPPTRSVHMMLSGTMAPYAWALDHSGGEDAPAGDLRIRAGERVALTFMNHSAMSHPMHLHGHAFQVVNIQGMAMANSGPFPGAVRDTVLVPPMSMVTVVFDANNPGRWPLHCHNLLHMATGMMSTLDYSATT